MKIVHIKRNLKSLALGLYAASILSSCDSGTTSDPSTNDLGEFNPPGQLQSITGDAAVTLRWIAANAEKDFQGYHVFGAAKSISELKSLATYPSGVDISTGASIPRCKDNSAFFEAFGFKATTTECKSTVADAAASTSTLFEGYNLAGSGSAAGTTTNSSTTTAEAETITFNLKCSDETASANVSRSGTASGKGIGPIRCGVSKLSDGTALANGTNYTFFVVAVKGSSFSNISWISNLVEDTPAKEVFSATVDLTAARYTTFDINTSTFAVTKSTAETTCTDVNCRITTTSDISGTKLVLARDTSTDYPMRVLVYSTGTLKLQARGPQTYDSDSPDTISTRIPGDSAAKTYDAAGVKNAVYGNQVFDLELTNGTTKNYGKLIVKTISYADISNTSSVASVAITIVMQPKASSYNYLQ